MGQHRTFNFGTQVDHTNYKPSLKGAWLRDVTHLKFGGPHAYIRNGCQILYTGGLYQVLPNEWKITPKGAWLGWRDLFKFVVSPMISPEWLKLETSNFVQWFARWWFSTGITNCPLNGRGQSHDVFKFSEISDNIWETVQNRDIVTIEDKLKIIYGLSNGMIVNDLEWVWWSV